MAINDILFSEPGSFGVVGSKPFFQGTNSTNINPGEPVGYKAGGASYVIPLGNSTPVISTDYMVGIAESLGTATAAASGVVQVIPLVKGAVYSILPAVAATYGLGATPVQATYNALVGSRVTFNLSAGVYTINSTDNVNNALVVEYQDVTKANGRVLFSVKGGGTYL